MLSVTLTAWTPERQIIGELLIRNDGTGDVERGNYRVTLGPGQIQEARVEQFPRALGAWHLVQCALLALGKTAPAPLLEVDYTWAKEAAQRLGLLPEGEPHG